MAPAAQQTQREDEEEGVKECDIFLVVAPPNAAISSYSDFTVVQIQNKKTFCLIIYQMMSI